MLTKRFIIYLLLSIITVSITAQAPSKRCPTCGKSPAACQYKGKHPKCSTCGKFLDKCQYRGKHAKCYTCGRVLESCQYRGNHPKCATCGEVLENCQYRGNHPKCSTCGKVLEECKYKGNNTTGYVNGHEWVDLGLSVKWATCNVGASFPEDYGGYYPLGETNTSSFTQPITVKGNIKDVTGEPVIGASILIVGQNYGTISDFYGNFMLKVNQGTLLQISFVGLQTVTVAANPNIAVVLQDYSQTLNDITLISGHDTARKIWGSSWRMPTITELEELCNKCKWTWITRNGKNGYVVTGPNGNSIFLPAAGYQNGTSSYEVGSIGYYWSSTLSSISSYDGCNMYLYNSIYGNHHNTNCMCRIIGQSVRPVTD